MKALICGASISRSMLACTCGQESSERDQLDPSIQEVQALDIHCIDKTASMFARKCLQGMLKQDYPEESICQACSIVCGALEVCFHVVCIQACNIWV